MLVWLGSTYVIANFNIVRQYKTQAKAKSDKLSFNETALASAASNHSCPFVENFSGVDIYTQHRRHNIHRAPLATGRRVDTKYASHTTKTRGTQNGRSI